MICTGGADAGFRISSLILGYYVTDLYLAAEMKNKIRFIDNSTATVDKIDWCKCIMYAIILCCISMTLATD